MADKVERAQPKRFVWTMEKFDGSGEVWENEYVLASAYDALAAELEAAEDRVRSYKLLAEQRHEKIRKLENSSLSERSRDMLAAAEKRNAELEAALQQIASAEFVKLAGIARAASGPGEETK